MLVISWVDGNRGVRMVTGDLCSVANLYGALIRYQNGVGDPLVSHVQVRDCLTGAELDPERGMIVKVKKEVFRTS